MRRCVRRGVTLVELLAVITVLTIAAMLVAVRIDAPPRLEDHPWRRLQRIRMQVLVSGRDSTFVIEEGDRVTVVTIYTDGSVRRRTVASQ